MSEPETGAPAPGEPKPRDPEPAPADGFRPMDSFARRLGTMMKKKTPDAASGAAPGPAALPPKPATPAPPAPAPAALAPTAGQSGPRNPAFDSFAGRLDQALKKSPPTQPAPAAPQAPTAAPSPFDSFAGRLDKALKQSESATEPAQTESQPAKAPPESAGPVGGGEHHVKQGECISSIAKDTGHFWETIWNDPANADLKAARNDPNVLLPGDRVHVPGRKEKWTPGQTEKRHRFRRRGEPAMLRLTLKIDDVALGNQPYTLEIDGQTLSGVTDPDGKLVQPIPPNAKHGRLIVGAEKWVYELQLGHIDPVESLAGVQKRLINLGFDCGRSDGQWDEPTREATRAFQRANGLAETGEPDDLTRDKLREAHGS